QAAFNSVRHNRAAAAAEANLRTRRRHALDDWDHARAEEVAAFVDRLECEPIEALAGLRRTAEGCDAVADLWDGLGAALRAQGPWDGDQAQRALRLLGQVPVPTARDGDDASALWLLILASRPEPDPPMIRLYFGDESPELPDRDEARAALAEFVASE